ncbi:hypothetical protein D6C77_04392 [Aureobasidium pullulans]|nr:hypothetical protein D6D23_09632 [Aureobasidium pullulans]THY46069.1 hypothetical protein D6C97_08415 [Aureobasidium pullulans]TIA60066.1 hypothetical protein D6C77_04392 [Aureobasidium pullulans]
MDCFLDFCLACDKQTSEGLYCSQACRLADLEKAGSSTPSSPFSPTLESSSRSYFPTTSAGFQLPEAFSFKPTSMSTAFAESSSPRRALSPSSSRSSLSSSAGSQSSNIISEQARTELQTYVSAFDQTREMKRRSLSSH